MCCLFGLLDPRHALSGKQTARLLHALATASEVRGTDATGFACNSGGRLLIRKSPVPGRRMAFPKGSGATVFMGHTRMTTQGNERRNRNNHPFFGQAGGVPFALAHNGVLTNDRSLRKKQKLPVTKIETDSYVAVQLLEKCGAVDMDGMKYMAEQVQGTFSFTVLDSADNLFFIKGDNPLCLYHWPRSGLYLYASTEEIVKDALSRIGFPLGGHVPIDLTDGDILRIDRGGRRSYGRFSTLNLCRSRSFWSYCTPMRPYGMDSYVEDLKSVAGAFGYAPEDVDTLLADGITPEEIEAYLYEGEPWP